MLTQDVLAKCFSGKYYHKAYTETTKLYEELLVHADGLMPKTLIEARRPSESQEVFEYRKKIWESPTKDTFGKVINSLQKIRRSSEWSILFSDLNNPSILENESLKDYCTYNFPGFTSITNWAFNVLLRTYLLDSNALIAVFDDRVNVPATEYQKPFPFIFYSNQIIDYEEGEYAVLLSTDKVKYGDENRQAWGDVFYVLTKTAIARYEQMNSSREMRLAWEKPNVLGELPIVKTKGQFKRMLDKFAIFESRLSTMVPRLNEAVREYSDLQAEVVQHIHSEKWEYSTSECHTCKGNGNLSGAYGKESVCSDCGGTGAKARGPYSKIVVNLDPLGSQSVPTPPVGYVQKNTDIVKIQDERVDKHIFKALSAVNMQFLDQTPLAISGEAKQVDREELSNFVHSIAEDLVAILDKVVYFISEWRYFFVTPSKEERKKLLPTINVPESFDLLSATHLENELKSAKDNRVNPVIVTAMEIEYANKKFHSDPRVRERVELALSLDPLAGISEDDKMTRLSNGGITKLDYVMSSNLQVFISRALDEHQNFLELKPKEKKEIIKGYALEQIKEQSAAQKVLHVFGKGGEEDDEVE